MLVGLQTPRAEFLQRAAAGQGAGQDARTAADRCKEGSGNPGRLDRSQGRYHEARGDTSGWRRDRAADQGGAGGLRVNRAHKSLLRPLETCWRLCGPFRYNPRAARRPSLS